MSAKPSRRVTRRKCATCEGKFAPPRADAVYCSPKCRQRAYRARVDMDDIDRRIDEARLEYWRLIYLKASAVGNRSRVVTEQAQFIDEEGNVYIRGEAVGWKEPFREGWAAWGLEAGGPTFSPPTQYVDKMARRGMPVAQPSFSPPKKGSHDV